jgi:hypothetical protein
MATSNSFQSQPSAASKTMLLDGLHHVLRTRWQEPTLVEREKGREEHPISPYEPNNQYPHGVSPTAFAKEFPDLFANIFQSQQGRLFGIWSDEHQHTLHGGSMILDGTQEGLLLKPI